MALMTPRKSPRPGCGGRAPPIGWDPGSHPRRARSGLGGAAPAPLPSFQEKGTQLLSIRRSPVTNVMLVNKARARHPGTTQAQTRRGVRARAHPEFGRQIRSPKCV